MKANYLLKLLQFVEQNQPIAVSQVEEFLKKSSQYRELEAYLRTGMLHCFRRVDENNNGVDFISLGEQGKNFVKMLVKGEEKVPAYIRNRAEARIKLEEYLHDKLRPSQKGASNK